MERKSFFRSLALGLDISKRTNTAVSFRREVTFSSQHPELS
jgi:hypothetical protein